MSIVSTPPAPDNFGYPKSVASIQAFLRRNRNRYVDLTSYLNQEETEGWISLSYSEAVSLPWFGGLDVARVAFSKGASHERVICYATSPAWRAEEGRLASCPVFVCDVIYRFSRHLSTRQFSLHGLSKYISPGAPGYKLDTRAMTAKLADDNQAGVAK